MDRPLLEVRELEVIYDKAILAVRDVTLAVGAGEIVAILGANGAGKSTTLKAISGVLAAERGERTRGSIAFNGLSTAKAGTADLVRQGLVHVLEGRPLLPAPYDRGESGAHLRVFPEAARQTETSSRVRVRR
jgi:branched-chain amino acid transport system ATP-binding protein